MEFRIDGGVLPYVTINLQKGEMIYTDKGDMISMSETIEMQTKARGGLMKSLGRMFSKENFFLNEFRGYGEITLAPAIPGSILHRKLENDSFILQKNAFMAATENVELKSVFTKKIGAGLFGGEGFILQEVKGYGDVFLEFAGSIIEKELKSGESLMVDNGHIAFFESSVNYEIKTVKGVKNVLFGGEQLFLCKLTGPGRVGIQSMTASTIAGSIIPFLPTEKNESTVGSIFGALTDK